MPHLLHGTLFATIYGIDRLHTGCGVNMFSGKSPRRFLSKIKRTVLCRPELVGTKLYATIDIDKTRMARTRMVNKNPNNPMWHESFYIYCAHVARSVVFTVKNDELVGATLIGRAHLPVSEIINGGEVYRDVAVEDEDRKPTGSNIRVRLRFVRAAEEPNWSAGVGSPDFPGIPRAFFNQRQGCRVTLYQDAHVRDDFDPNIVLSSGKLYRPGRCWEDILAAISGARHMVYITGWAVSTKVKLTREPGSSLTLGELLKRKADEGVAVLVLVWDDRTSLDEFKKDGLMATHDEETEEYFRGTNVRCFLCPRNPDGGRSFVQGFQVSAMFTHHQKTIVVDAEIPPEVSSGGIGQRKRRVVSFLGGIDLCDGRYDTQDHPLFSTLGGAHRGDFHQPNFPGASERKGGPREPWHDVHCRIEGPAAWDVLYNFEQRWKRQVSGGGAKFLLPLSRLDQILVSPASAAASHSGDPERWSVQVFRSIDGGSATGFPEDPKEAAGMGLVTGKDNVIERSIQDAYIQAIRRAKSFVYIENQYFLGSSYGWRPVSGEAEVGAMHLVPNELSLKIVSKIEAGERFMAYVVVPMWPEGIPESASVQAILEWQRRTMEMMYADIADALRRAGMGAEAHPRDYLAFFCLGNREERRSLGGLDPPERPDPGSDYSRAQQARRFMIYVHSKMMIVDDEYIIIGSANINQRSMDGARDSEIAMGAFQPSHLAGPAARGQVYGFRMSLWYEHLGMLEPALMSRPESLDCVRMVSQVAEDNWDLYCGDIDVDLPGHLLRYPVEVTRDGIVTSLPGSGEFFPDTKAKVLGTKSDYLPPILTT